MLKIKDNVDLKELEKFGFYKEFDYYEGYTIIVYCNTREIEVYDDGLDKLYDLIKEGLVEKVVEDEGTD